MLTKEEKYKLSTEMFNKYIIPSLKETKLFDEIFTVEGKSNKLYKIFDMISGVDAFVKIGNNLHGLASRIQKSKNGELKIYKTFSLRNNVQKHYFGGETELERVMKDTSDVVSPYFTTQSYVNTTDNTIMIGICLTKDLKELIKRNQYKINHTSKDDTHQSQFYTVKWSSIEGYKKFLKVFNLKYKTINEKKIKIIEINQYSS